MIKKLLLSCVTATFISQVSMIGSVSAAEAAQKTAEPACPGQLQNGQKRANLLASAQVGKKVQEAYEMYAADDIDGALKMFLEIKATEAYDIAYVARLIGIMYVTKGDMEDKAIEQFKKAIKPNVLSVADHSGALRILGDLLMQQEKYKEAVPYYNDWMTFTCKEDPKVWQQIAIAYFQDKSFDKVITPADKAIKGYGEKQVQVPYVLKVRSYYEQKKYKDATDVIETIVQLFPEDKQWWLQLANFYVLTENQVKALATLELAHKQGFVTKESELKMLAGLYLSNNVPYKSAVILDKYINEGVIKRDQKTLSRLANSWHAALEIDKAAKVLGEVAKLTNDARDYRKQGMLYKQDEQFQLAINALNKALELGADDSGTIHMAIAESYFYLEKYKNAYEAIKVAVKDPKSAKSAKSWQQFIAETAKRKGVSI